MVKVRGIASDKPEGRDNQELAATTDSMFENHVLLNVVMCPAQDSICMNIHQHRQNIARRCGGGSRLSVLCCEVYSASSSYSDIWPCLIIVICDLLTVP